MIHYEEDRVRNRGPRYSVRETETEREITEAAKRIDNLQASSESTVAGRAPNLNLRLLVPEGD
jgi:hypothetical protein